VITMSLWKWLALVKDEILEDEFEEEEEVE
jgi:hypothetical protein